jgi:hypothetical protein
MSGLSFESEEHQVPASHTCIIFQSYLCTAWYDWNPTTTRLTCCSFEPSSVQPLVASGGRTAKHQDFLTLTLAHRQAGTRSGAKTVMAQLMVRSPWMHSDNKPILGALFLPTQWCPRILINNPGWNLLVKIKAHQLCWPGLRTARRTGLRTARRSSLYSLVGPFIFGRQRNVLIYSFTYDNYIL